MSRSNLSWFILGLVIALGSMVFISATTDTPKYEIGRYQISSTSSPDPIVFVVDTETGETKICFWHGIGGSNQLGLTFDKMDKK